MDRFLTVFKREYFSRVKTKAFWIGTALMPVFMIAVTILPAIMAEKDTATVVGVQDQTGRLYTEFEEGMKAAGFGGAGLQILPVDRSLSLDQLDSMVVRDEVNAYVRITDEAVATGNMEYRGRIVTNINQQRALSHQLSAVLTNDRYRAAGYSAEALDSLQTNVRLDAINIMKADGATRGEAQMIIAVILFFALYMMLMIYGSYILRAVLEEKSSRIVEVVLSSLRPIELLVGKVSAVGAVGLTQMVIWVSVAMLIRVGPKMGVLPDGATIPMPDPALLAHTVALFVLGFAIYGALFAAIAAIHNNEQEAQQFQWVAMAPLIMAAIFMMQIISAPESTVANVLTFIPLFTPLIMLGRIASGAMGPTSIAIGYAIMVAFTIFLYVFVARIYRVGILMYGKRPTPKELLRWMTY